MIPTLEQWLVWLSEPSGLSVAAGVGISWLAEYFPWWYPQLAPKWKRLVFLAACLLLSLATAFLRAQLGYAEPTIDLYWNAIAAGGMAFGVGQTVHAVRFMGRGK